MKKVSMMCIPVDNFQGDEFVDLLEEVDMDPFQDLDGSFIPARIFCPSCNVTMIGEDEKLKYDNRGHLIDGWLTEKELNEYNNELAKSWNIRSLEK